ncbi:ORF6N domain-containing protein, partial [Thermodesulfobacteriota bacterium]
MKEITPVETVVTKIIFLRDEKVLLDRDLAELYGVETKVLKRAVRRNIRRFPLDFMFELNQSEFKDLRNHFGTSSWGGTRYTPMVFTEQGVAMLSSVLNSEQAIKVNITIMRAFVQLRKMVSSHSELTQKLKNLENHLKD